MNDLTPIRCVLMRGGTSRGPFFLASDLPSNIQKRDEILLSVMGVGHPLQIDGIGGGNPVTSKVAIIGPATVEGADVDYLFAQVRNDKGIVDTSPNCGNMLAGVGPFAIEAGLVRPTSPSTLIRIHNVNTGALIEAEVQVDDNQVRYKGDSRIDGVPGTAAPIYLTFLDGAGSEDKLFPTGKPIDVIDGIEVTCINAAMPIMMVDAQSFGVSGYETPAEMNANKALLEKMEQVRRKAGQLMGLGDVSEKVVPKPVLIAKAKEGNTLTARYFMPAECHPSMATTGAVSIAAACIEDGTIASRVAGKQNIPAEINIGHPSGRITVSARKRDGKVVFSILRTARRLFEGYVYASLKE